jgi:hypothetical protein
VLSQHRALRESFETASLSPAGAFVSRNTIIFVGKETPGVSKETPVVGRERPIVGKQTTGRW